MSPKPYGEIQWYKYCQPKPIVEEKDVTDMLIIYIYRKRYIYMIYDDIQMGLTPSGGDDGICRVNEKDGRICVGKGMYM